MSISTKRGDAGQTGLAGGIRISKADLRVEAYGSVDELNTVLGFARSICHNKEIAAWTEQIQRTLFRVGAALATGPESSKNAPIGSRAGETGCLPPGAMERTRDNAIRAAHADSGTRIPIFRKVTTCRHWAAPLSPKPSASKAANTDANPMKNK